MSTRTADETRIYVACLAAYNNGQLHGRWIDATQGEDGIREEIREMLSASPQSNAEEWAIHDYEGFSPLTLSEYEDIGNVAELAEMIQEHGKAYAAYADHVGRNSAPSRSDFEDHYRGDFDSEQAYAESLIDDGALGEIPEALACYIDTEKFAHDLFISDCYSVDADGGGVHVFSH
jgi:antirestriction protein